jgi:hypothetical protein
VAHPSRADAIFRLRPAGSTSEPPAMPERDGDLIGRPVAESSAMARPAARRAHRSGFGQDDVLTELAALDRP